MMEYSDESVNGEVTNGYIRERKSYCTNAFNSLSGEMESSFWEKFGS